MLLASNSYADLSFNALGQGLGLYLGLAVPLGDFAESYSSRTIDETNAGFSGMGAVGGIRYIFRLGSGGLGWAFDASVAINSFDETGFERCFREQMGATLNQLQVYSLQVSADSWWFNIPAVSGPVLRLMLTDENSIYIMLMAGVSVQRAPEVTVSGYLQSGQYIGKAVYSYEKAISPGAVFEMGLIFRVITFGIRFSFMGSKNVGTSFEADLFGAGSKSYDSYERNFPVTIGQFLIGYLF